MRFVENIRLAVFFGFLTGLIIGLVDILSKIIAWSFEWFELHLTLFTSIISVTSIFVFFGLCIAFIKKVLSLKATYKDHYRLYFASSISFLLLFYGFLYVHISLLTNQNFTHPASISLSIVVILISGLFFLIIWFRGKKLVSTMLSYSNKKKVKKTFENAIFLLMSLIIFSFIVDYYLLNSIPAHKSYTGVEESPNIIFIYIDGVRPDHTSLYGYQFNTTPNLDKLAVRSVVFENAISTSSYTLPSVASMLTGKYSHKSDANFNTQILYNNQTLLPEILREKGYVTASIVGSVFIKGKYGFGQGYMTIKDRLDFFEYVHSYDKLSIKRVLHGFFPNVDKFIFRADDDVLAPDLNKDVFKWLDLHKDQTFFLFIGYSDVHQPYNLGTEFKSRFTNKNVNYREVQSVLDKKRYEEVPKETIDYVKNLYDTELFYLDHHLGELFKKLDELEINDETILIIVADHGTEFYDHGDFENGRTLYQEVIHVPLLIHYPKEFTPQRINERVSTIDIFSTILELVDIKSPDDIDSMSLVPLIKKTGAYNREVIFSQILGSWDKPNNIAYQRAVIKDNWKLIEVVPQQKTLPSSLFNLKKDPREKKNLYSTNIARRKLLQNYLSDIVNDK